MTTTQPRLRLSIDVFSLRDQQALVLPELTPPELIRAILSEFSELEFLGANPEAYRLRRLGAPGDLDDGQPLAAQLTHDTRLELVERAPPPPAGARPLGRPVYLREQVRGLVFPLTFQPAIIGRPDSTLADDQLVAVDLAAYTGGLRVSRRHARIVEEGGRLLIESLSPNPTAIKRAGSERAQTIAGREPLGDGDMVVLERSQISLKVIIREPQAQPSDQGGKP